MADLYIGLMSGTSMDGIDAALVDLTAARPDIVSSCSVAYPAVLRDRLAAALQLPDPRKTPLVALDEAVGEAFAGAANRLLAAAGIPPAGIRAIGSHGQTLRHEPDAPSPYSLQIGSPAVIAAATGIDVVADFRQADIEAGGQGAPLVPAFHKAVFADPAEDRVVLNIGGIANITILPADPAKPVTGYDTGPGNTLMDCWAHRHLDINMDMDGQWAAGGRIDPHLLETLLADPYFDRRPPKSTGLEHFNLRWLSAYSAEHVRAPRDVQATLCELTARSIADAIRDSAPSAGRVLVCGGGVHNGSLMQRLSVALDTITVESTLAHGIDPDWVEAIAFAWLAKQLLEGKPGNIPEVTGARGPALLGRLWKH